MSPAPPTPNRARLLFEKIKSSPEKAFQEMIDDQEEESEFLEFKAAMEFNLIDDAGRKKLDEHWAKILGGFANTEGGVVIWGLSVDRSSGLDRAKGFAPAVDPPGIRKRLKDRVRDITEPPVAGVEVELFAGGDGSQVIVCYIPESLHRPHRSESGIRRFYIRTTDDFIEPSVSWLRKMFEPRLAPAIVVLADVSWVQNIVGKQDRVRIEVALANTGNATAHDVCLICSAAQAGDICLPQIGLADIGPWRIYETGEPGIGFSLARALHPGEIAAQLRMEFPGKLAPLEVKLKILAQNMKAVALNANCALTADWKKHQIEFTAGMDWAQNFTA